MLQLVALENTYRLLRRFWSYWDSWTCSWNLLVRKLVTVWLRLRVNRTLKGQALICQHCWISCAKIVLWKSIWSNTGQHCFRLQLQWWWYNGRSLQWQCRYMGSNIHSILRMSNNLFKKIKYVISLSSVKDSLAKSTLLKIGPCYTAMKWEGGRKEGLCTLHTQTMISWMCEMQVTGIWSPQQLSIIRIQIFLPHWCKLISYNEHVHNWIGTSSL